MSVIQDVLAGTISMVFGGLLTITTYSLYKIVNKNDDHDEDHIDDLTDIIPNESEDLNTLTDRFENMQKFYGRVFTHLYNKFVDIERQIKSRSQSRADLSKSI